MAFNALTVKRYWNAATNDLALRAGFGETGDAYLVTVGGTVDIGQIGDWQVGDVAFFALDRWVRVPASGSDGGAVSVAAFGVKPGNQDNTDGFARAALYGGMLTIPPGDYRTGPITLSKAGTALCGLGRVRLLDVAGVTSALITIAADYCMLDGFEVEVDQSPSLTYLVRVKGNSYVLNNMRTTGPRLNLNTPNSYPAPNTHILVQGDTAISYTQGRVSGLTTYGGRHGLTIHGGDLLDSRDLAFLYPAGFGFILGGGLASQRCRVSNVLGYCCGQYAFSFSNLTSSAAATPFPVRDIEVLDVRAEKCGWGAWYTGNNGAVAAGKYGLDITTTAAGRIEVRSRSVNCQAGGLEVKRTQTSPVVVPAILPDEFKGLNVEHHDMTVLNRGQGLILTNGLNGNPAGGLARVNIRGSRTLTTATPWQAGVTYKLLDIVTSDGYYWQNFGTPAGAEAASGNTAPAGGKLAIINLNAATAAGSPTLSFASTTDATTYYDTGAVAVADGMVIFAGPNLTDGATVKAHTGTTVTIDDASVVSGSGLASGSPVIFGHRKNDGVLNWQCIGSAAALGTGEGIEVRGSTDISVDWDSYGFRYGCYLLPFTVSGNALSGFNGRIKVRGATYGVMAAGTGGTLSAVLRNCDVEAQIPLYIGGNGNTETWEVLGGRFRGAGAGSHQAFRTQGGNVTARFVGCTFQGNSQAVLLASTGTHDITSLSTLWATDAAAGLPCQLDGTTTWRWGYGSTILNGNPGSYPGFRSLSGALTTMGRVERLDLGAAAPTTATKAGVGEFFSLNTPTATVDGYVCRVADHTTPTYTWNARVLT